MLDAGVVYALLAACFGGAYIFSIKRFLSGQPPTAIAVVSSLVSVSLYAPVVVWTTPGLHRAARSGLGATALVGGAAAIVLSAAAFLLFLAALGDGDVSYVAPLSKTVPAFVLPIEIVFLQAFLTPVQVYGVAAVTAGVYVANYQQGRLYDPLLRLTSHRPARLALGSALVYGAYDVLQRFILHDLGVHPYLWVIATRVGIALLLLPIAARSASIDEVGLRWRGFALVGALNACLAHFGILAFSLLPASIASPLVNAQSIVAVGFGGLLLRETGVRYRALGAVLAIAGIGLIVAG